MLRTRRNHVESRCIISHIYALSFVACGGTLLTALFMSSYL